MASPRVLQPLDSDSGMDPVLDESSVPAVNQGTADEMKRRLYDRDASIISLFGNAEGKQLQKAIYDTYVRARGKILAYADDSGRTRNPFVRPLLLANPSGRAFSCTPYHEVFPLGGAFVV
jgi:hypothetical protein